MAILSGGAVKSVQKLSASIPSQAWPAGTTTVKTFPVANVVNFDNAVVFNSWWYVESGTVGPCFVFADVTATNVITVVVTNMGAAAFTAGFRVGGTLVEYA